MRVIQRVNGVVVSDNGLPGKVPSEISKSLGIPSQIANSRALSIYEPQLPDPLQNTKQDRFDLFQKLQDSYHDTKQFVGSTVSFLKNKRLIVDTRPGYQVLCVEPSKLTANTNVKWLMAEISRIYTPMMERINLKLDKGEIEYKPELTVWWEIHLNSDGIKFYMVVPNEEGVKTPISRQIMKTWKQANVREVSDPMPKLQQEYLEVCNLRLMYNSILSIDTDNPTYSPLDSILNAKHYLVGNDKAILQIGIQPLGNGWNDMALLLYDDIKKTGVVPRKKNLPTKGDVARSIASGIGLVAEEVMNFLGDFLIPGWEDNRDVSDSLKKKYGEADDKRSTKNKIRSDAFRTTIRVVSYSENDSRRSSIVRALTSGFDPLEGDNKFVEKPIRYKQLPKVIDRIIKREHDPFDSSDVLCSLELSKIVQVPDQKAQVEHYNELALVNHRGESEVPKDLFIDDGMGVPFVKYEDVDGQMKLIYFNGKSKDKLCMARVYIGEPGTGKTTMATNMGIRLWLKGYGVILIDAADGDMITNALKVVPPDKKDKVKIIDFLNRDFPVGIGWNEAFRITPDSIEDILVEEVISYIELVAETELNMTAKQWVENAVKAVFVTPEATLQDVENMLSNASFREAVIPTISDPQLRADWEYFHVQLRPDERKGIYDQAFRRLSSATRKKSLKTFILQKPKKDENGEYMFDLRKWMDEGYLVLVRANETLGEAVQTALVSFLISKLNLAMISREDTPKEDRPPCFVFFDEPDHYINGSERWRNMLTRYRKYRCGLNLMFHGWQQLVEKDKNLPKIIRKAGPHYIIYHTDLENMLELKTIIEPEFKIADLSKGMPQHFAVIKLNEFTTTGQPLPAFMAKGLAPVEETLPNYDNTDLYQKCAEELGRPKQEVLEYIFSNKTGAEFDGDMTHANASGEGELDIDVDTDDDSKPVKIEDNTDELSEEDKAEKNRKARMILEYKVGQYIEEQIAKGQEPDMELVEHMDELLEEG